MPSLSDSLPILPGPAEAFERFLGVLSQRQGGYLHELARVPSAFEGWLKLELYLWLAQHHGLDPRTEIALDREVWLDGRQTGRHARRCDLRLADAAGRGYHYLSLRVSSASQFNGRAFLAAFDDFRSMSRLAPGDPSTVTGSSILLGTGFDEQSWQAVVREALEHADNPSAEVSQRLGRLAPEREPALSWAVLTRIYPGGRSEPFRSGPPAAR